MYVYEMMRGCVCAHESVEGVALAPLVLSVKLPWRAFLFSDAPLRRQTQFLHLIFISLLTTEFAVCVNKKRKDRMCHKYFTRSNFHLQVKELSFLPPCWEHLFALLFCLTGLPLIRTKRHEEAPWRLSVGMTSLQNTFYSLGNSRGVARYALKGLLCWPKVLHATSLHTSFFLYKPTWVACDFWGQGSLKQRIGLNEYELFHRSTFVMLKAVHHFYKLC